MCILLLNGEQCNNCHNRVIKNKLNITFNGYVYSVQYKIKPIRYVTIFSISMVLFFDLLYKRRLFSDEIILFVFLNAELYLMFL